MGQSLTVTYYHHSGFSVSWEKVLLVFDYWLGDGLGEVPEEKRITPDFLAGFEEIYVFVSHEHGDHLDPVIYEWRNSVPGIMYIVSSDMPVGTRGKRMAPGDVMTLSKSVTVKAFSSTDLGVSYLVDVGGIKVFHAGDLNFWHWRETSTAREIEEADQAFRAAVEPIAKELVDVAFFPADPRLGLLFDAGANYFLMAVKPRLLIPMHFWGRGDIAVEFARRSRCRQTEIIAMTQSGEKIELDFSEDGFLTVHLPSGLDRASAMDTQVDLGGYEGRDPFNDTDLPVDIGD